MSLQYLRKLQLILADSQGKGLDVSNLRCQFRIVRGDSETPNSCDARIYGLSDTTAYRIQREFTTLSLSGGYQDNVGLLFKGTIKQIRKGRESALDTYLDVTAADADSFINFSTLAVTLAAGNKPADAVQVFLKLIVDNNLKVQSLTGFKPLTGSSTAPSTALYYAPDLPTNGSIRARTFYGMTRDELRQFAFDNNCKWSLQDGKLLLIPYTSYMPNEVVVLSSETGLIGTPEQQIDGIHMRILLNAKVKIGQRVKLDQASVNRLRFDLGHAAIGSNQQLSKLIATNTDGTYYVMRADHFGDTRGDEWFSDLTCLSVDTSISPATAIDAAIFPDVGSIKRY